MLKTLSLSLLTITTGAIYAFCYPSFLGDGSFILLFFSLPFFLWRLESTRSMKELVLILLLYNLGFNLVGYYWIPHTLREFGRLNFPLSLLLGFVFGLILQPHWWIYLLWKKFRPNRNWNSEQGILLSAFIMTILERYIPQQFPSYVGGPWLHLAPYLGLAPFGGVALFSFMTYWISLEITSLKINKTFRAIPWLSLTGFIFLNLFFPLKKDSSKKYFSVRIVQANIGNFLKIQSETGDTDSFESVRKKYESLSLTPNQLKPELIVWPETAYPHTFYGERTSLDSIFKNIMTTTGAEMVIGGYNQHPLKNSWDLIESVYNSSLLLSGHKVKSFYHKNILIPFGETLPFGPLNSQIVNLVPAVSLFARGEGTPLMETKQGHRFITPICYEILDSDYIRNLLNRWGNNHMIINHTNDSWYGNTAEPYQHLFLSKWRALEFNLPIVRSTNTGISSVIFSDGSESRRLGIGEEGVLDVNVPLGDGRPSPYQNYGILSLILLYLGLTGLVFLKNYFISILRSEARP